MQLIDLENQYQYREENMQIMNRNKMQEMLKYFFYLCQNNHIRYVQGENLWNTFVDNYYSLSEKGFQKEIDLYMKANGFQENAFIYELLHDRNDNHEIQKLIIKQTNKNIISLYNREIEFMDADQYFKNTELEEFFKTKQLAGECFDRSLELLFYLPNSNVIVSYLPNIFAGGYYHAYISCDNGILVDPASNLVLLNQEAKDLLNGQIIFSMNQEEVETELKSLGTIHGIVEYDRPQLLKLALFYECNSIEKEKIDNIRKI